MNRTFRRVAIVLLTAVVCVTASAQSGAKAQSSPRPSSTPYSGDLSIFDYPERAQKLHITEVMDLLGIQPGSVVADIGAGSGWFTVLAAERVTPSGHVFAVDINSEAVAHIRQRAQQEGLGNISAILGTTDDPKLPAASVNAVLLLKTYHEVANPVALMRNVRAALQPGACVGIIDRTGSGTDHGVQKSVVIAEMKSAGFRLTGEHDDLVKADKMDYFLVFVAAQ